jgi:hypothetical protein
MAIDKSGDFWRGTEPSDLEELLAELTAEGYPMDIFRLSKCACESDVFRLKYDPDEGGAQRICASCKKKHFICDSEEYWEDAEPHKLKCGCKSDIWNIGVGFSMRENHKDEVFWITIAGRCTKCGLFAGACDWKIDYSPSKQLIDQA